MMFKDFCSFLEKAVEPFTITKEIINIFEKHHFTKLNLGEKWNVNYGGTYYTQKSQNALVGLKIGPKITDKAKIKIVATHLDSPNLKIKPNGIISNNHYTSLNTEIYGGLIHSTWLDRPLGIAGQVIIEENEQLCSKVVKLPINVVIPNLAIHLNKDINNGYKYNPQIDLLPLLDTAKTKSSFKEILSNIIGFNSENIKSYDLSLYVDEKVSTIGLNSDLFIAPRIDNLECAYASLIAFANTIPNEDEINIYVSFNNEEVGSKTKQGADSTFLSDVIKKTVFGLGFDEETYICMLNNAFMISADNAHAIHPNIPQKSDPTNYAKLNEGIVIKHNASQSYTTDALSWAIIAKLCDDSKLKYQHYTNRSDERGGGTLGNVSSAHLSINCVDIGCSQLAMHSALETAGIKDFETMVKLLTIFYQKQLPNILQ